VGVLVAVSSMRMGGTLGVEVGVGVMVGVSNVGVAVGVGETKTNSRGAGSGICGNGGCPGGKVG
jgi:hypothetical protein